MSCTPGLTTRTCTALGSSGCQLLSRRMQDWRALLSAVVGDYANRRELQDHLTAGPVRFPSRHPATIRRLAKAPGSRS